MQSSSKTEIVKNVYNPFETPENSNILKPLQNKIKDGSFLRCIIEQNFLQINPIRNGTHIIY